MIETSMGGAAREFRETLWTVVLLAKDRGTDEWRPALDELIRAYWRPVYFYLRRRGNGVEAAKDLTQAFFTEFVEKDVLRSVEPAKGRFRNFVLAALSHFLSKEYDRRRAQKRGGGVGHVSLDYGSAETEYTRHPPVTDTPERLFAREWSRTLMSRAMEQLRAENIKLWDTLKVHLASPRASYQEMADKLGVAESDLTNHLCRARKRLREILVASVRAYVLDEKDVQPELAELFQSI